MPRAKARNRVVFFAIPLRLPGASLSAKESPPGDALPAGLEAWEATEKGIEACG
jgi:hypothetical protein